MLQVQAGNDSVGSSLYTVAVEHCVSSRSVMLPEVWKQFLPCMIQLLKHLVWHFVKVLA